ncbi:MAG: type VI secretion system tip protein VgrG [Nitrococcus mobilis]|nr:type VI secretion system tip protein VgrG [Nitrococcus mobilis]
MSVTERLFFQAQREISLATPLGEDVLGLRRLEASEELGRPFSYDLDLLSPDPEIRHQDLLGENVTIRLKRSDGGKRFFNGHIARFMLLGYEGQLAHYRATMVPWLWFLGRTSDCRIFQEKSIPQIVASVFREHGFTDFEEPLTESYEPLDYVVRYRETDLNFVSRLLEQEGIYYFFRHEDGKHTLVLCDSYSCHEASAGYEQIPFYPRGEDVVREQESLWDWRVSQEVQPGACALNDFDFKAPRKSLRAVCSKSQEHHLADFEIYDYPGGYIEAGNGERYARIRMEERQAGYELIRGEGNVRGLNVGALFELANYPRADQNREYLVVSASYEVESTPFESGAVVSAPEYCCRFTATDARTPFRPRRVTPKPVVQGPQTAMVVGQAGEEIWTDKHGRVKLQFHWDRYGKADENSSCWVRVSQPWAGKNWGAVSIPRIGQEVIVECLEGDPDRPIVTGRVYNGGAMAPYDLPGQAMVSGVKSNSTPGGGGSNELSMDDSKGKERVYLHAQKDQAIAVENDESHTVGHDRSKNVSNDEQTSIGNNRSETVGSNENIIIGANRTESVGGDETVNIAGSRTRMVSRNETVTVALARTHSVGVNEMINVGGAQETNVGGGRTVIVGGAQSTNIGAHRDERVFGNHSENVGGSRSSSVGEDDSLSVDKNQSISVGKNLTIEAGEQVVIKTGKASITMKKDGTITIQGKDITLKGSGEINIKASKNVVIKGQKVLQN